ncbi:MAG: lipopolysaccharide biosynthesis protein [Caulobacter sp.]|nr:lipopolysaccharide biosynthesis protein [Caulobacter sp.]
MYRRGLLGYLPANITSGLVGLLTIVVFTRLMTPQQYGAYALAMTVMILAHTLLFTWTEAAMARFQARARERGDVAGHMATIYRSWLALALAFPLAAGLAVWIAPISDSLKVAVAAGLLAVVFRSLIKLVQERRRADGEVGAAALLDMAQSAGGFAAGVVYVAIGFGGGGPLMGMAVVAILCLIFTLRRELTMMRGGKVDPARLREYAGYGMPVALSLILALVISSTDRFLLAGYLNEESVGIYHAGYSLANRTLDVVFIWLGMAGGPAMVAALERGGRAALAETAREQASFMVLLTLPAAVGVALVAGPLAQVMVGEALVEGAAHVTPWIAIGAFFSGVTTYYLHQAFTLGQRTKLLTVAMTIPAGLNLALNLVLIPRYGIDGAMWATAISYTVGAVASFALGRSAMPLPLPLEALWKGGAGCVAMAVVVLTIPALGGILELALKAGAGAIVYGLVVFALDAAGARTRRHELIASLRPGAAT